MHNANFHPSRPFGQRPGRQRATKRLALMLSLAWVLAGCWGVGLGAGEAPMPVAPEIERSPETAPASAAAEGAAREAEIARVLRMIFDERSELAAMRRAAQARTEETQNTQFALERSIAAWEGELTAAQAQWSAAREARAAAAGALAARQAVTARWRGQLAAYPRWLQGHIENGIAFDRAGRLATAARLAEQAAAAELAPAALWQQISRAQESEEGLARTLELATVAVAEDRAVDGLRVGLVLLTAPTADGGAVAIGPGARPESETAVAADRAAGLASALQILQRRRSPEFSDLYVPALATPAAAPPLATPVTPAVAVAELPAAEAIAPAQLPAAVAAAALPADPPTGLPAADGSGATDPLRRLEAALTQARAAKAAFMQAAATAAQAHAARVSALEEIEAERRRRLNRLQAAVRAEETAAAAARDGLALEHERQTLFREALLATRAQLFERLTGSLEAAATPAIAEGLARLQSLPKAAAEGGATEADGAAANDAEIDALIAAELGIYERLLAASRGAAAFSMAVRLADGRVIQAQCLQPSLLPGYFADPQTRAAGLLVADRREVGVWRGQVQGLSGDEREAIAARLLDGAADGLLPVDVSGGAAAIQAAQQWNLAGWFEAGGKVMWPLLIVALAGLALGIERAAALLRLQGRTRDLLARVETALQGGDYETAQRLCDPTRGPVQRVLHAALSHRAEPRAAIEDAIQVTALGELPQLQKGLGMLALLAGLAPLLGLLGTVTGMINTFHMVNLFGSSDTRFLAGGISEALITTEFGLAIAIPLVFAHGILGRLAERILAAIELGAAMVMQRLGNLPSASGARPAVAAGTVAAAIAASTPGDSAPGGGS